ncbi:MAG: hypothetical protein M1825_005519 [Sarcosagium campestre]|nr:MAG: hypothetical protein M1825_005519 [Sarcosagium campestre]
MDFLLGKVTQQAMNYAIRVPEAKGNDRDDLLSLKELNERLEKKIRIISPAIDMIELLSARGNTSLESAMALTRSLRWEFQSLGQRMSTAASAEEQSKNATVKARQGQRPGQQLQMMIREVQKLLDRIDDAVPLINLAITTSGARLSTTLPNTVSPSRLLQASTFLTGGDTQYSVQSGIPAQIGPSFTVSMYMLFVGHSMRKQDETGRIRGSTWQEVIHKARVKLRRVPLDATYHIDGGHNEQIDQEDSNDEDGFHQPESPSPAMQQDESGFPSHIGALSRTDEFAYQLLIIEDFEDDRVHTFEPDEQQPGPCDDVKVAGIREVVPVHEISKIFYADTGKILNIGNEGEANRPVLLLKRDVNALPPRKMMDKVHADDDSYCDEKHDFSKQHSKDVPASGQQSDQSDAAHDEHSPAVSTPHAWKLPKNLDPEWIAFEVYSEDMDPAESEDEDDETPTVGSKTPPPAQNSRSSRENSLDPGVTAAFSGLNLNTTPQSTRSTPLRNGLQRSPHTPLPTFNDDIAGESVNSLASASSRPGPITTSLSLLELLIRLTALQQFQQISHLSVTDELLNFFLAESGATGAGTDGDERRRKRDQAREKVGFDPYDESPVKFRGEAHIIAQAYEDQRAASTPASPDTSWPDDQRDDLRWSGRHDYLASSPLLLRSRESIERATPPSSGLRPPASGSQPQSPTSLSAASPASTRSGRRYSSTPAQTPTPTSPPISTPASRTKGRTATLRRSDPKKKTTSPLGRLQDTHADSSLGTSPGYNEDSTVRDSVEDE